MKKFLFFVFVVFLLFSFEKAYANMKAVKKSQVFSCDGVMYGYHGDSIHYHRVVKKGDTWYPDGDEVVPPCAPSSVEGSKEVVTLSSCVDGDTAKFITSEGEKTVRFLAIDTPETVHPKKQEEPFGKEASNYTCDMLTNAKEIVLEYDPGSEKTDKYDRYLAWVFVDGVLLQQRLVEEGFASVSYLYGDYLYTSLLQDSEEVAKVNRVGRWNEEDVLLKEKALHEEGDSSFLDSLFDKIEKWFEELFKEVRKFFKNLF